MRLAVSLALAAILLSPAPAAAGPAPDPAIESAREHFRTATAFFEAGEYAKALAEFEAAYSARPLSAFQYNIGVCQERLGHFQEAVAAYKKFLADTIDPAGWGDAKERVEDLEQVLATGTGRATPRPPTANEPVPLPVRVPAPAPAPVPSPLPPPAPEGGRSPYLVPLIGAGVALAFAAAGIGLIASVAPDYATLKMELGSGPTSSTIESRANALELRADIGYVLCGLAAAVAAADVALFVLARRSAAAPRAWLAPAPGGLIARGRF